MCSQTSQSDVCKQTHSYRASAVHKFTAGCKLANNLAREEEYEPPTPEEKCDTLVLHNFTTF
jgi:hypothetical protein